MAITSVGYDGTVNETQWAKLIPLAGSAHYGVAGAADWKVTPHATMDRGINIAVGTGWGHGVYDTSDATVSLQGGTVSSGSRWDLIVARRNWSGTGGATTFQLIAGSSAKQLPTRNTTPGTLDDQPIALVRFAAGQTAVQEIVDLRVWARNGGMVARDTLALTYVAHLGAQLTISNAMWLCVPDINGNPSWVSSAPMGMIPLFGAKGPIFGGTMPTAGFYIQAGSAVTTTDAQGFARVSWQNPFPQGLLSVVLQNGDDAAAPGCIMTPAGGSFWGTAGGGNNIEVVYTVRDVNNAIRGGLGHRVNFIAIGW